ncbi:MAG: type II secretion system F family protein [Gaiellaceae bacterium]
MTRRRLALVLAALAALALAASAAAGVSLRGVDAAAYPTIRATLVTSKPSAVAPSLLENGQAVVGLQAENLGLFKSVVLAVDRSRSMQGAKLADAARAAAAFVATKPAQDRIALVSFGRHAVVLSRFSTATIDADSALRTLSVDSRQGTALYDAVVASANALAAEQNGGRVIILLTDGRDVSSRVHEPDAVTAARKAGAVVYPIAVGSDADTTVLRELATATGGTFYGAASSKTLGDVYSSIAQELQRTWRLEYVTAARPGDRLDLAATIPGQGRATAGTTVPASLGDGAVSAPKPAPLPGVFYGPAGSLIIVGAVALLALLAAAFGFASAKGSWVRKRLQPHVAPNERAVKRGQERERLAVLSGLFGATEKAFGHRRNWRRMELLLERADVPLRTVEFAWLITSCSFGLGLLFALAGRSTLAILAAFAVGGLLPYGFVWHKARSRLTAFENQLPDLLITMAASLKAGHSFKQGIQTVVDEGQEPAAKELKRVLTDTRLGRPMDEALAETAERIGSKNFSFVITAVTIQRQVGGSLAGLFDMVADTVRQRQQFARKIRSLTAMGRASAYVLVGLPFVVAFAITLLNPAYMDPLYHSSRGHFLIFLGLTMMAFGSLILKKIVSFRG